MTEKATLVGPIALLIAAVVLVLAAWKFSKDVRITSESNLADEEAIATSLNRQYLAKKNLEDRLKAEAAERQFNLFLYGSTSPPPEVVQQQIEKHLRDLKE